MPLLVHVEQEEQEHMHGVELVLFSQPCHVGGCGSVADRRSGVEIEKGGFVSFLSGPTSNRAEDKLYMQWLWQRNQFHCLVAHQIGSLRSFVAAFWLCSSSSVFSSDLFSSTSLKSSILFASAVHSQRLGLLLCSPSLFV